VVEGMLLSPHPEADAVAGVDPDGLGDCGAHQRASPSCAAVAGPTTPSTASGGRRYWLAWNARTAASALGPKSPSTTSWHTITAVRRCCSFTTAGPVMPR